MSLQKIKKLLETKERVAKLKADKAMNDVLHKKKNIGAIDDYRKAYLAAGRKIKNISGYELANIESFIGNMANVSAIEGEECDSLRVIQGNLAGEWQKCLKKATICNEMVYNIGINNAYIKQEELTENINWLNMLKRMEK